MGAIFRRSASGVVMLGGIAGWRWRARTARITSPLAMPDVPLCGSLQAKGISVKHKFWTAIAIAAVSAVALAYFASPILAFRNLRDAGIRGDRDELDAAVDFPVLRSNLKSDMNALMLAKMGKDPALKNNPFGGLAIL